MPDDPLADIPMPLRKYVDVSREGWVTLSYPMLTGYMSAELVFLQQKLEEVLRAKGKERNARLSRLQEETARSIGERVTIFKQWDEYRDRREAARRERREAVQHG
jgi:hypothetical protein